MKKTATQQDWLLTTYGKFDKIIEAITIKDRTEKEANNESFNYVNAQEVKDWTLIKMKDAVKNFVIENGSTHKGAKDVEGFSGGLSAESECLINVGYVWVEKFKKWINKNNSSYDKRDEEVLKYIQTILQPNIV